MLASNYPTGWHAYVRAHVNETAGYVVAQSGVCLNIKDQETTGPLGRVTGRKFRPIHPNDLDQIHPPRSWLAGIILCPGDDLEPILTWVKALAKADHSRIVFYVHPDYDQAAGAKLLEAAGLAHLRTTEFHGSWTNFHKVYGNDHCWQTWNDRF